MQMWDLGNWRIEEVGAGGLSRGAWQEGGFRPYWVDIRPLRATLNFITAHKIVRHKISGLKVEVLFLNFSSGLLHLQSQKEEVTLLFTHLNFYLRCQLKSDCNATGLRNDHFISS